MILSEASSTSVDQIGIFVASMFVVIGGALSIVYYARNIWVSFSQVPKNHEEECVSRAELKEAMEKLERLVQSCVGRAEYQSEQKSVEIQLVELKSYLQQRVHDLMSSQQAVVNTMAAMSRTMEREIGRREGESARIIRVDDVNKG